MNLAERLEHIINTYPNKIAIVEKKACVNFGSLGIAVRQTASYLAGKGIVQGMRVLVLVPMSIDLYRIALAINYLGAIAVFPDQGMGRKKFLQAIDKVPCDALVGIPKALFLAKFLRPLRNIKIHAGIHCPKYVRETIAPVKSSPDAIALITFTSGSTTIPKAAERSYSFLEAQRDALHHAIPTAGNEVFLVGLPMFVLLNLANGVTSVIADLSRGLGGLNPKIWVDQIRKHAISDIIGSPDFLLRLSDFIAKNYTSVALPERIYTGGAPVFPNDALLLTKAFPNSAIKILYGSTEAEPICEITADDLKQEDFTISKGLCVGKPYNYVAIRIIPITSAPVVLFAGQTIDSIALAKGETGEIVVAGKHVLDGYTDSALSARYKIKDGDCVWHRTGDAGFMGANDNLYLTGPCNQMMKTTLGYFSLFVAEAALKQIHGVERGTILCSKKELLPVIQLQKGANKSEVIKQIEAFNPNFCSAKFVHKIPMDFRHHSKIDYPLLRAKLKLQP